MTEWDFLSYLIQTAPTAALFFFLWRSGIIRLNLNDSLKEQTPNWAQHLEQYFNHDITEKLEDLSKIQNITLNEAKKVNTTLSEWERYGVPQKKL